MQPNKAQGGNAARLEQSPSNRRLKRKFKENQAGAGRNCGNEASSAVLIVVEISRDARLPDLTVA